MNCVVCKYVVPSSLFDEKEVRYIVHFNSQENTKKIDKKRPERYATIVRGCYGDFKKLNAREMQSTTAQNICKGCPKHPRSSLEAALNRRAGPGQS